jgi:hypothetical protein
VPVLLALLVTSYDFVKKNLIVQNGTFGNKISNFGHGRLVTLCPEQQQQQQSCQKKRFQLRNWLFFKGFGK